MATCLQLKCWGVVFLSRRPPGYTKSAIVWHLANLSNWLTNYSNDHGHGLIFHLRWTILLQADGKWFRSCQFPPHLRKEKWTTNPHCDDHAIVPHRNTKNLGFKLNEFSEESAVIMMPFAILLHSVVLSAFGISEETAIPADHWTLQWKGLNLFSRGPGSQNSKFCGVKILRDKALCFFQRWWVGLK